MVRAVIGKFEPITQELPAWTANDAPSSDTTRPGRALKRVLMLPSGEYLTLSCSTQLPQGRPVIATAYPQKTKGITQEWLPRLFRYRRTSRPARGDARMLTKLEAMDQVDDEPGNYLIK